MQRHLKSVSVHPAAKGNRVDVARLGAGGRDGRGGGVLRRDEESVNGGSRCSPQAPRQHPQGIIVPLISLAEFEGGPWA